MAKLKEVLLLNDWSSATFQGSLAVNKLMQDGIVIPIQGQIRQDIDGLDSDNMKSVIISGIVSRTFMEPTGMNASDTEIDSHELDQTQYSVKTFYQAYSEIERQIQTDIMPMSDADAQVHLVNVYGTYWATHWNKIMANTIKGMSATTGLPIIVGTGTADFSRTAVINARKIKGDLGFGKIGRMYMNSTTIHDILVKIEQGTIASGTLVETYGTSTIVVGGVQTMVTNEEPTYKYNGVTTIEVDDDMADGDIAILEKGSFGIGEKSLEIPLETSRNALSGGGSGISKIVSRKCFILHPLGFNFAGILGTNFASNAELTYAELQTAGMYTVENDVKNTKIVILKVKIGA